MTTHAGSHPHPYHLVDPSPWPIVGSISAALTFGGAVYFMHSDRTLMDAAVMLAGFLGVLYTMVRWFSDVVREGEHQGHHTPVVQIGLRFGMALFIMSEVLFFAAFFWAYFNASLFPTEQIGSVWPPNNIKVFDPWSIPFLNTVILLSSGGTVTLAHHALRGNKRAQLIGWLAVTIALGITFTAFQAYEYSHAPFRFVDGVYPSTFFMATGFHGFHVIVGTLFLSVMLLRAILGHFKPDHHFGFEAAAWYWHFVDVVWLFLFTCVYWWPAA
ncbi:MAG: cytochrome c oxidase subunit 3 [Pseudomonadota bacterium]